MTASDPHLLGPGLLSTPFTAEEIRVSTGAGATIRIRVDLPDGTSLDRVNRFIDPDAAGATLERWSRPDRGDLATTRVTWLELQRHAAFAAETTALSTETLSHPLGELVCLRYETPDATYWFSPQHPGMPVRYESDGVVTTVVGIERTNVGPPA